MKLHAEVISINPCDAATRLKIFVNQMDINSGGRRIIGLQSCTID